MSKLSNNDQGFSAIELVMIIVIICLIGAVAYFVYKNHHQPTKVVTITKTVTTTSKTTTSKTPISSSSVSTLLTNFYNQYIAIAGNRTQESQLVKQYGTSNLQTYFTPKTGYSYPADPILCAQATPSGISVTDIETTSDTATASVVEGFTPSSSIKVSLVPNSSGNLMIDSITCNPPLVASPGSP